MNIDVVGCGGPLTFLLGVTAIAATNYYAVLTVLVSRMDVPALLFVRNDLLLDLRDRFLGGPLAFLHRLPVDGPPQVSGVAWRHSLLECLALRRRGASPS